MAASRWIMTSLILIIVGSGWIWLSQVPADAVPTNRNPQPAVGYPAPDFELTTLGGEPFMLSELQGRPVVLNFWATWCGPCRRELPALQAAHEHYGQNVTIVGVDQAEAPATVQLYVDQLGLTFPVPMDADQDVANRYNVMGLPTTFFIDPEGIIRRVWSGEMNSITLAEGIEEVSQ